MNRRSRVSAAKRLHINVLPPPTGTWPHSQLAGIDLMKYIMAYGVVAIHFRPNVGNGFDYLYILDWFIKLAVPFFFITSGYLLQRKIDNAVDVTVARQTILTNALKILRLWTLWLLISLPMALYTYANWHKPFILVVKSYFYDLSINGWAVHAAPLWFLYSMFWVTLLVGLTYKKKYAPITLFLFFATIAFSNWYSQHSDISLLKKIYHYTCRPLGGGLGMMIGIMLYKHKWLISKMIIICALTASLILIYFHLPYGTIAGGAGLFMLGILLPLKKDGKLIHLRSQSMWIYYLHEYVLFIVFELIGLQHHLSNPYLLMTIIFTISAFLAYCLFRLQTGRFKFLTVIVR